MQKAGGIIALIAGILGTIAAGITLLMGGLVSMGKDGDTTVIALGWGGVVFSFLVIILGAVAMGSNSRVPGALILVSSIAGAILGGTLVAIFMMLSGVGGVLAMIGVRKNPAPAIR